MSRLRELLDEPPVEVTASLPASDLVDVSQLAELDVRVVGDSLALSAIDEGRDDAALCVSAAKAQASKASRLIGAEAIQMHGGIGMTDEEEIGLFLKRAKAAELAFGDAGDRLFGTSH